MDSVISAQLTALQDAKLVYRVAAAAIHRKRWHLAASLFRHLDSMPFQPRYKYWMHAWGCFSSAQSLLSKEDTSLLFAAYTALSEANHSFKVSYYRFWC